MYTEYEQKRVDRDLLSDIQLVHQNEEGNHGLEMERISTQSVSTAKMNEEIDAWW